MLGLSQTARRRVARVVLMVAITLVVVELWRSVPREVDVRVDYGDFAVGLRRTVLSYMKEGGLVRRVAFTYADRAPRLQRHKAHLRLGSYELKIRLQYEDSQKVVRRRLVVEGQEEIRIELADP